MSRLPQVSGKDVQKAFLRVGFRPISQRGSHLKMRKEDPRRTIIIPNHKVIKKGTLSGILRDADISTEEFVQLLKKRK